MSQPTRSQLVTAARIGVALLPLMGQGETAKLLEQMADMLLDDEAKFRRIDAQVQKIERQLFDLVAAQKEGFYRAGFR